MCTQHPEPQSVLRKTHLHHMCNLAQPKALLQIAAMKVLSKEENSKFMYKMANILLPSNYSGEK